MSTTKTLFEQNKRLDGNGNLYLSATIRDVIGVDKDGEVKIELHGDGTVVIRPSE